MNKLIAFCISITIVFASCKQDTSKEYSTISVLVDEAEVIINKHDNNVQSALDSKKYDYIKTVSESALDSSNVKIKDLKLLPLSPINEEIRITAINYIKALQNIIEAQKSYASITDTTSLMTAMKLDATFEKSILEAKRKREIYLYKLNLNIKN